MRSLISPCKTAGVRCFENSRLRLSLPWRSSSLQYRNGYCCFVSRANPTQNALFKGAKQFKAGRLRARARQSPQGVPTQGSRKKMFLREEEILAFKVRRHINVPPHKMRNVSTSSRDLTQLLPRYPRFKSGSFYSLTVYRRNAKEKMAVAVCF